MFQKSLQREKASAVIVVGTDKKRVSESYGANGKRLYCIQDTAAAIENIMIAVCSMGLGTCWIGTFKEDEVRKVVNPPTYMHPVALFPVGYPNESPSSRARRPVNEIMYTETF
jgi:nitroreductase